MNGLPWHGTPVGPLTVNGQDVMIVTVIGIPSATGAGVDMPLTRIAGRPVIQSHVEPTMLALKTLSPME